MKCKYCDGTGTTNWCVNGTFINCPHCGGTGEVEQTNEEYIKTCSTEELAGFIVGQRKGCVYADCPNGETPCMSCEDGCDIDKLVEWLKQPHSEVNHERRYTQAERKGITAEVETIFEGAEQKEWTKQRES